MRSGREPLQLSEVPLQPNQPLSAGTDAGALRDPEVFGPADDFVVALLVQPEADILFLRHASRILRQSSEPVCGFSTTGQVRLCAIWPRENWLGSSRNHVQG